MSRAERRIEALERENAELRHRLSRHLQTGDTLWMESGVSSRTGEAFIHMRWGDEEGQLTPAEAREHATRMIEVAAAAEFDAAFVKAMTDPGIFGDERAGGLDMQEAVRLLALIRQAREGGGGPDASAATPRT